MAVCGFLLLAVIVVFAQTFTYDFVNFDDNDYVYENPHVRGGLTRGAVAWAMTAYHSSNWHPLTWLSHMLDCQIYGLNAHGHHLTNVLLHAAAAVFLFLALRRMTRGTLAHAWVAAVFALHPLRVESVVWVAERKDVLSGLLFTLTLWLYARYVERPASWGRYLLVVATFALGLTAKPMLVTLPFVLLLLDYWPLRRVEAGSGEQGAGSKEWGGGGTETRDRQASTPHPPCSLLPAPCFPRSPLALLLEKVPLFVLAGASCLVTHTAQGDALASTERLPVSWRAANAASGLRAPISGK